MRGVIDVARYLVHVAAHNLGRIMLALFGVGTPRGLQGPSRAIRGLLAAILAVWATICGILSSATMKLVAQPVALSISLVRSRDPSALTDSRLPQRAASTTLSLTRVVKDLETSQLRWVSDESSRACGEAFAECEQHEDDDLGYRLAHGTDAE
ncbi:MAG: hypothetical protein U1E73_05380 [Planctomycetota bacterium]